MRIQPNPPAHPDAVPGKFKTKIRELGPRIKIRLIRTFHQFVDPLTCSPFFILRVDRLRRFPGETRRISVAITHFERAGFRPAALKNILNDERVSEILILDDGSSPEGFARCRQALTPFRGRVRLFRRDRNMGAFVTKLQAVTLCSNPWCLLLDSDNTVFRSYLDAIFELPGWDPNTIFCPGYSYPHFDFRGYGNLALDFDGFNRVRETNNRHRAVPLINDGNYFLNVEGFSRAMQPYMGLRIRLADVTLANYIWLSRGNQLRLLSRAAYHHRLHPRSSFLLDSENSMAAVRVLLDRFSRRERAEADALRGEFGEIPAIDSDIRELAL